jgi:hypothetical protein
MVKVLVKKTMCAPAKNIFVHASKIPPTICPFHGVSGWSRSMKKMEQQLMMLLRSKGK